MCKQAPSSKVELDQIQGCGRSSADTTVALTSTQYLCEYGGPDLR